MRTFYSIACATFVFLGTLFLMLSWHGIWSLGELGNALATYRSTPFSLMILSLLLAVLFGFLASRFPLYPENGDSEEAA